MPTATPSLGLPYLAASQAQKHVTLNESLRVLEALVQLSVASATDALSGAPDEGLCQIVPVGATGDGAGHDSEIAAYLDGAWQFHSPQEGWRAWVRDTGIEMVYDGAAWVEVPNATTSSQLGINASADGTNRLVVSSPAALFNHDGNGHQLKINKASAGDTASLLFQTDFSGRAEFGLAGDDAFRVKVSPDGSSWYDSLAADPDSGRISFPAGLASPPPAENLLLNGDFAINQRGFAGGSLGATVYGMDRWRGGAGGCSVTPTAAGVQLVSGNFQQVLELDLEAGATLVVSFESGDTSSLTVSCFGATGTLLSTGGRHYAVFTVPGSPPARTDLTFSGSGDIAKVKLEHGAWPTPWAPRAPELEFLACAAYFEQRNTGTAASSPFAMGVASASAQFSTFISYLPKRDFPSVTFSGAFHLLGLGITNDDIDTISAFAQTLTGMEVRIALLETLTVGQAGLLRSQGVASAYIAIDAELHGL
ncbi:MAG: DUF2793 domain-containing protein [Hyphomonadaceae bacterium]|nr:DUF2793 domain-containing protein [Hyphomonadaceae bacterium]